MSGILFTVIISRKHVAKHDISPYRAVSSKFDEIHKLHNQSGGLFELWSRTFLVSHYLRNIRRWQVFLRSTGNQQKTNLIVFKLY